MNFSNKHVGKRVGFLVFFIALSNLALYGGGLYLLYLVVKALIKYLGV